MLLHFLQIERRQPLSWLRDFRIRFVGFHPTVGSTSQSDGMLEPQYGIGRFEVLDEASPHTVP